MTRIRSARALGQWLVTDSGVQTGAQNMAIDQNALDAMLSGEQKHPSVRFFQWDKAVVTFGYLMDPKLVSDFARKNGSPPIVKRPTGGGTVLHKPGDLSLSLLWPRRSGYLPDAPRECYAVIHDALLTGVRRYLGDAALALHAKTDGCGTAPALGNDQTVPAERFSLCFQEPVCNDVMMDGKKVVGGALRITRQALLYQGAVQLGRTVDMERLKNCLLSALMDQILKPREPGQRAASYLASLSQPEGL